MAVSDRVYVQGIEFEASHGYTAAERKSTRRFRCNIELAVDLDGPSRTDQIRDTIDYRALCAVAVEIGTSRTFKLLEALAGAIADAIQARYPTTAIAITVEKLAPPCPGAPAVAGVRIMRGTW